MFIVYYKRDGVEHFFIYFYSDYGENGYKLWLGNHFVPLVEDARLLDFRIKGKDYKERQESLREIAKNWQLYFSYLGWSYSELGAIMNFFTRYAKQYGLVKEFKENGIC